MAITKKGTPRETIFKSPLRDCLSRHPESAELEIVLNSQNQPELRLRLRHAPDLFVRVPWREVLVDKVTVVRAA